MMNHLFTPKAICILLFIIALGWYCTQPINEPDAGFRNLAPEVGYVGMETCRSCHADIHATFQHTGMGRSFDWASQQKSAARFGPEARVYDEATDLYYFPFFRDSNMYILEFRLEGTDTVHQRLEQIDYIVGSGQHTNSHILSVNGYCYQAPITYYTQAQKWDMAPGFDEGANLRFSRALHAECLTCHNHYPSLGEGALHQFHDMPRGIECERCHGPGELHVREKLAGIRVDTAVNADYSIVNPRRLSRDLQLDLCQRCHLQGIAVLEPGKTFFDFRPGMRLSEIMQVFLPRYTNSHQQFIMASQADRLRLSACFELSDMTCLTCHNPHVSVEATGKEHYNQACEQCHQAAGQVACSAPDSDSNCIACHMPPSASIDIPHVSITDHYIRKDYRKTSGQAPAQFLGLELLTKPNATALDMALGYLAMYDKYMDAELVLDSAAFYLEQVPQSDPQWLTTRAHYLFNRQQFQQLSELAYTQQPGALPDAWTAYRFGEAMLQLGNLQGAHQWYARAVALLPRHPEFIEKLAVAHMALQQWPEAEKRLREVLEMHPRRPIALNNLGYLHALRGQYPEAMTRYEEAIALDPDYVQALLNKAALLLQQKETAAAKILLKRVLKLQPNHEQAQQVLKGL